MHQSSHYRSARRRESEKIFEEVITENFPKVVKEVVSQVQETHRVLGRINPRKNTMRHIVITLTKIKVKLTSLSRV